MPNAQRRPKYLNLLQIRLPLPGVLSILHRVSGMLLVFALPFFLAALQCSIASREGYDAIVGILSHPLVKLAVWAAVWALLHHLCAGIRFLLLDMHMGTALSAARASSVAAFIVSLLLTALFGVWLWL